MKGDIEAKRIDVDSVANYIKEIMEIELKDDEILLYRGHSSSTYELVPGIYRDKDKDIERKHYRQCMIDFPEEFSKDHINNLSKIQHYKQMTRLLDVTTNPLIALEFALSKDNDCDVEVVIFKVKKSKVLHHTSDKAMMLACLANFSDKEKRKIRKFCMENKKRVL